MKASGCSANRLKSPGLCCILRVNRAAGSASHSWSGAATVARFLPLICACGDRTMERRHVRRPDDEQATKAEGTAAVKSPSDVGSSPASDSLPPDSSPTLFVIPSDAPTISVGAVAARAGTSPPSASNSQTLLRPGTVLARRYEILQIL